MAENSNTQVNGEGSTARIVELAKIITASVSRLEAALSDKGVQLPSFDEDSHHECPIEAFDARDAVLDASSELYDLLLDPLTLILKQGGVRVLDSPRFKIADMVPAGGQVPFSDIAKRTGLNEGIVRRLLRYAITMRVFREPQPGLLAHTQASKALTTPSVNYWLSCGSEEMWPASIKMLDAIQNWPDSQEPNHTGFALAHNITGSTYDVLGSDSTRALRFAECMNAHTSTYAHDLSYVLDYYDWTSLGHARVVDIGGAKGHVALALASRFPNLTLTVQDMEAVVKGTEEAVPADLKERVHFMAHSLFTTQTIEADVYYLRWILHNWSDKYCARILKAQVPVLKPGARILIQESCMPEPGETALWIERDLRMMDLTMGAVFNAQERTVSDWRRILQEADSGFVLQGVVQPKGSALALIDVRWEGE